jgi:hypothetical protein
MLRPYHRAHPGKAPRELDQISAVVTGEMQMEDAAGVESKRCMERLQAAQPAEARSTPFSQTMHPDPFGRQALTQGADFVAG